MGNAGNLVKFIVLWAVWTISALVAFWMLSILFRLNVYDLDLQGLAAWLPSFKTIKYFIGFGLLPPVYLLLLALLETQLARSATMKIFAGLVVSAAVTALAFPQADFVLLRGLPVLAWIGLTPLLYFLYLYWGKWKEIFLLVYVWEIFFTIFLLYWLKDFADLGVPFLALVLSLYRALPFAIFFAIASKLPRSWFVPVVSALFLMSDALLSYGYLAFPWGYIGYTQAPWPAVTYWGRWGGIWLISFLIVAHNSFLAAIFAVNNKKNMVTFFRSRIVQAYSFFLLVLVIVSGIFFNRVPDPGKQRSNEQLTLEQKKANPHLRNFVVVQPVFDPWASWRKNRYRYFQILKKLTEDGLTSDTDFLLWTESSTLERFSFYEKYNRKDPFQEGVKQILRKHNVPLLTGSVETIPEFNKAQNGQVRYLEHNAVTFINEQGKVIATYSKNQLVPFGEWFPYDDLLPGIRPLLDSYGASMWEPGKSLRLMHSDRTGSFGPLICYEGIFYRIVRQYVQKGANYLINLTNLMWTKHYSGHIQHSQMAQLRAMEQNRYFIRAANDGLTCLIDPYGRIINSIPLYKPGYMRAWLDVSAREKTFYARFGDWFLYLLYIFIGLILLVYLTIFRKKEIKE